MTPSPTPIYRSARGATRTPLLKFLYSRNRGQIRSVGLRTGFGVTWIMATAPLPAEMIAVGSDLLANGTEFTLSLKHGALERNAARRLQCGGMKIERNLGIPAARIPEAFDGPGVRFRQLPEIMVRPAPVNPNVTRNIQAHFLLLDQLNLQGIPLPVCYPT